MTFSPEEENRLKELMDVFLEENSKLNLSAYRTEEQCWMGNVLDSVCGAEVLEEIVCHVNNKRLAGRKYSSLAGQKTCSVGDNNSKGQSTSSDVRPEKTSDVRYETHDVRDQNINVRCLDIGTGGGFPLFPLAILFPKISFTGLDATRKKIDAVGRICEKLSINNVQLITGRTEETGRSEGQRERYDIVTSRAVASLSTLLEYMSPFVRVGGHLLCWKSMNIDDELTASVPARMALNTRLVKCVEYGLPDDWGRRQILVFEKTGKLSGEYPRGVGVPKGEPL